MITNNPGRWIFLLLIILVALLWGCAGPMLEDEFSETTGSTGQYPMTLKDIGEFYVLGGDMLLDKADPGHQDIISALTGNSRAVKKVSVDKWPGGSIPFYYADTFTAAEENVFEDAMLTLEMACNVNFYETTAGNYRYRIRKGTDPNVGGSSTLGYTQNATFNVSSTSYGTVLHELVHGLGFSHEHQRGDRDSFVTINWDNIEDDYKSNFDKIPVSLSVMGMTIKISDVYGSYDYGSIMHYGAYAFNENSQKTIDAGTHSIGQRTSLSNIDRQGLVDVYGPALNLHYTGNFDGLGGHDLLAFNYRWGLGVQKYSWGSLVTSFYAPNNTWFGSWRLNAAVNTGHDYIRGTGDFDGDGDDDILISSSWGIGMLTNTGSSLNSMVAKPNDTWFGNWRLNTADNSFRGTGDFDGDGDDDVLVTSPWGIGLLQKSGSSLYAMVAKPKDTWFGSWRYNASVNTGNDAIRGIGDYDGDGDDDILVTSSWGLGILAKSGSSMTATVAKANDTWFGEWRLNTADNSFHGTGDFDGDGDDDILITSPWGIGLLRKSGTTLYAMVAKPKDTWFGNWRYNASVNTGNDVIRGTGDFDGDGDADILVTSSWGLGILTKSGSSMTSLVAKANNTWFGGWRLNTADNSIKAIADFDGDGDDDILISSPWGQAILTKSGSSLTTLAIRSYTTPWWNTTH